MKIAVLAVQGAFIEHEKMLNKLGVAAYEIRNKKDFDNSFDGLILPGGESTVQGKLINELNLKENIINFINLKKPVFGTCAGLILLAKNILNQNENYLSTMDITAQRNAFGRQTGSFFTEATFNNSEIIPMTFIRAPIIKSVGREVNILSSVKGKIVAARQENQLVTAFHPELNENLEVYKYFLSMVKKDY